MCQLNITYVLEKCKISKKNSYYNKTDLAESIENFTKKTRDL